MIGSLKTYFLGFAGCLLLSLSAYFLATGHFFPKMATELCVGIIAVCQGGLFLLLFMDLGRDEKPDWNMTVFLFMIGVAALIVAGSIWIMYHLNYNLMIHPS